MSSNEFLQYATPTLDEAIARLQDIRTLVGGDAPFCMLTHDPDGDLDAEFAPVIDAMPGPNPKDPYGPQVMTVVVGWRILFGIEEEVIELPPEPEKPQRHLKVVRSEP